MNKYLLFSLLLASQVSAQVVQTARFEIPIYEETLLNSYNIVPWQQNGLMLYRRLERTKDDVIEFTKLDSSLEENWRKSVVVSKQLSLVFSKGYGDMAYFLFKPKNYFGDFQLFSINKDSTPSAVYTIKNIIPFSPTMFEVGKMNLVIAGYYNYRPVVILYSMITNQSKLLPGFFNDPGELNQLILNPDESVDVVVNMKNFDRKRNLTIMNYSSEGNAIKNTVVNPPSDKNLIFGRMMKSTGDTIILAGVYGKNAEYSRGVFVASINTAGEYTTRYYNFAELRNFFKYLRVGRQNRIKERIERKKVKGKKIRFNYRIAVQEFIPYEDHFLLLGEAFYPVYKNTYYSTGRSTPIYYGQYYSGGVPRDFYFDGYRYTHAVAIGIAKDGKLLWDNSFEIKEVKSFTLNQYVHLIKGENLNLLYSYDNKLYSKIIKGTEVVEGKSEEQMQGMFEGDKVKKNTTIHHRLQYWYGTYLLSYGEQEIQNSRTANVTLNRHVFFISKITFKE